jgi:excisionase family DNA binding protein
MQMNTKWLTKKELTRYLPISLRSIENYVKQGIFKSYRIGGKILFNIAEIDEAIQGSALPGFGVRFNNQKK